MRVQRFEGVRAVVTGAASGIGRATAARLLAEGASVGLVDLDAGLLGHTADELRDGCREARLPGAVHTAVADVSDMRAAADAVRELAGTLGGIDVCVTAAGFGQVVGVLEVTDTQWRRMVDVSLNGTVACAQEAARAMRAQGRGGSIVLLSSINAFVPGRGNAHYSAAKAAVATFAKAAAFELGGNGIRVNALAPGVIRTPLAAGLTEDAAAAASYLELTPLGRFGEPEDVAAAACFLASRDASYITGHLLVVDGGITSGIDFIPQG